MKKQLYNTLIIVFAALLLISAGALILYYIGAQQNQNRYAELSEMINAATIPRPSITETPDTTEETAPLLQPELVEVTDPESGKTLTILSQFKSLYLLNNHIVGWMRIPGTDIDYPVMQTPDEVDYYLKHNFDREYSSRGCLYAREICDIFAPSDNITIYGHRMRDGSMFARLDKYMDKSFWEENPYIYFDTLTELHTYKIMAVFLTTATQGEGFYYHTFVDAASEAEFNEFVTTCQELSLYDTGVNATYGDKFITLSTCEYSQTNGRLVIVALRIA